MHHPRGAARQAVRYCWRSFDNVVCLRQQQRRYRESEVFCGLEIDDQRELRRLFERQIGGLCPVENARNEGGYPAVALAFIRTVRHQAAVMDQKAELIDG